MTDIPPSKTILEPGTPEFTVSEEDSIDLNLRISNSQGDLLILYRQLYIINERFVPKFFTSLVVSMSQNETSEFSISQALYSSCFEKWTSRPSSSDVKLKITINEIFKPIDLMQDGNYIWRITASSKGRSLPHKKAKYKITAAMESNGKNLIEIQNKIVRASELPFIWEQTLMNMCEGESVIVECSLDNENSKYLSGSGTEFDVDRYLNTGKVHLLVTLHQFVIGKSVIKSVQRSLASLTSKAKQAFELKNFEDTEQFYTEIIQYIGNIKDPSFDTMQLTTLRNLALVYINLEKFEESESICSSILHIDPSDCKILMRRGIARIQMKKIEEGLSDLHKANDIAKENGIKDVKIMVKQEMAKLEIEKNKDKYWSID